MYGIPAMKLPKDVVERRCALMEKRGIVFRLNTNAADPAVAAELAQTCDAVVIAAGAREARTLAVPGMDATGVVMALDYLTASTRSVLDGSDPAISARGLDVVVIGGGDTGNDCVGTAVRQGARSVRQLEVMPEPPVSRTPDNPWPQWPHVKKTDYGQEEAIALMDGEMRSWSVDTRAVLTDDAGHVRALKIVDLDWSDGAPTPVAGSERELPAQLVLIACGFVGPSTPSWTPLAQHCRRLDTGARSPLWQRLTATVAHAPRELPSPPVASGPAEMLVAAHRWLLTPSPMAWPARKKSWRSISRMESLGRGPEDILGATSYGSAPPWTVAHRP